MNGRRQWFAWAALAYVVIIVVVTLGLRHLYTGARDRLDQALGDRLLAVATTLAATLDADEISRAVYADSIGSLYLELLTLDLENQARRQDLAEISLTAPGGTVLASSRPDLVPGEPNDYWELDRTAVSLALEGIPSATRLFNLQETPQKSAHAPVLDFDPEFAEEFTVAVVTVSGNQDFFDSLAQLRHGALLTGAMVLLVLVLTGVLLQRVSAGFTRYQDRLRRQENLAAMGRMTAGIAHEIRNPLGIIRGAGEHLQAVLARSGIQDPVAAFIPEEVDRLDLILRGYLSFGTDAEVEAQPFDLQKTLQKGAALLGDELERAGVSLEYPEAGEPLLVLGDPLRLRQVVLNLLINARDALDGEGRIILDLQRTGDRARIVISDTGPGLGDTDPESLFEPFRTTKEKGSGLGLAMSRRSIEQMGGTLTLRNRRLGAGAEALIVLPVHERKE